MNTSREKIKRSNSMRGICKTIRNFIIAPYQGEINKTFFEKIKTKKKAFRIYTDFLSVSFFFCVLLFYINHSLISPVTGSLFLKVNNKSSLGKIVAKTLIFSLRGVTLCLKSVNRANLPIKAVIVIIT